MKRSVILLFIVLIFAGLSKILITGIEEIRGFSWSQFNAIFLVGAAGVFVVMNFIAALVWRKIYTTVDKPVPAQGAIKLWFYSLFGKYAPLGIGQTLSRTYLAKQFNCSSLAVFIASVLEQEMFVIAAAITFFLYVFFARIVYINQLFIILLLAMCLFFSHPLVVRNLTNFILKAFKKDKIDINFPWRRVILWAFLYLIIWCFNIGGFLLFLRAFSPIYAHQYTHYAFICVAAFLAGYLAPFVPAGLGVREAALTFLLSLYLPLGLAAFIAITFRLFIVAEEGLSVFIAKFL